MNDRQRRTRIAILIGAHLLPGAVMALIAVRFPTLQDWAWIVVGYMSFVCGEILLLGMWLGLSAATWWLKLGGLLGGMLWLAGLSLAPAPKLSPLQALPLVAIVGVPLFVVAGSCASCRRWFAKLEYRDDWRTSSASEELQFSLKSLVGLTVVVSVLLALARGVRWITPGAEQAAELVALISMFAATAVMATGMLVWASLGPGRVMVRVPVALVAMTLLGLLPPYAMGGPAFRYYVWPSLLAVVAVCTAGSLLVIRSCGYRLVRIRSVVAAQPSPSAPPAEWCAREKS